MSNVEACLVVTMECVASENVHTSLVEVSLFNTQPI